MKEQYSYIGVRIVSQLKKLGKNQTQLCQETDLSTTAMSAYCTGKRIPETSALYRIAKALGTSMEWVLTGEEEVKQDVSSGESLCKGTSLSKVETDLISMFRLIDGRDQKTIFDLTLLKYHQLFEDGPMPKNKVKAEEEEEQRRIPYAASGWANITPEADEKIQKGLRNFEKRSLERKGK